MEIRYLETALQDLHEIGDWYRKEGGDQLAAKMVNRIQQKIPHLADNPYIAPIYQPIPELRRLGNL